MECIPIIIPITKNLQNLDFLDGLLISGGDFDIDPKIVRIVWLLLFLFMKGSWGMIYLIVALCMSRNLGVVTIFLIFLLTTLVVIVMTYSIGMLALFAAIFNL